MLRLRFQCNDRVIVEVRSAEVAQEIIIGRSSTCAWRAPSEDGLISGQHAVLKRQGRQVWLYDQLSKNGTWLKGKRIKQRKLKAGDRITMGRCVLIVEKDQEKAAAQSVPQVVALTGKLRNERKPILGAKFTIGSDPKADLLFLDDLVSRNHAVILRKDDGGYWLKDLGSTNGTKVNGVPLRPEQERLLKDDDHVTVAHMEFVFREASRDQGQALRRLAIMALVALVAVGGYYGWRFVVKAPAQTYIRVARERVRASHFDAAEISLNEAINSRGYKDVQIQAEFLRRQIARCKTNLSLRLEVEQHLEKPDWSAAAAALGALLSLPGDSWEGNGGMDKRNHYENLKWLLNAYSEAGSDISRPDLPLDEVLSDKSKALAAAIKAMESARELQALRKAAAERLKMLNDQVDMYRELRNVLKDLETWPPPEVGHILLAVESVAKKSEGALRERAERILQPLRLLSAGYSHLVKTTQLVCDLRFREALSYGDANLKANLPPPDACVIDSGLSALRANLQNAYDNELKPQAQRAELLIDSLQKRVNGVNVVPEDLRFWEDPTAMEKVLSCDSLGGPSPRRTRSEPQGEYDRAVFIEGFYDYLRSIADGQPASYAEAPFQCVLAESFHTVRAAKNMCDFFAVPKNQWLRAGQLAQWEQTANRILATRDKIAGNLLNTARQSSGRKSVIAAGIAWRLMDAPEKEKMGDQPFGKWFDDQLASLRRAVRTLNSQRETAEVEERIKLRDKILEVGLPGDPIVKEMWAARTEAGTDSRNRAP